MQMTEAFASAVAVSVPIFALAAGAEARGIRDRLRRPDEQWERDFAAYRGDHEPDLDGRPADIFRFFKGAPALSKLYVAERIVAIVSAVAWLVVDLPVMIAAPSGWAWFYVFSEDRGADWGSIWYLFEYFRVPVLGDAQLSALNRMSALFFIVACAAIAWLALAAPRRPRLPQLCFLVLAAFLMTNKVWSPQYVIWLVPLAVLARPRLWPYVLWQLAEVA